jgi:hypothetical protein
VEESGEEEEAAAARAARHLTRSTRRLKCTRQPTTRCWSRAATCTCTATTSCASRRLARFLHTLAAPAMADSLLVPLHVKYIAALAKHRGSLAYHLTTHLRLNAIYWAATTLHLLGAPEALPRDGLVEFTLSCWDDDAGGSSSCPPACSFAEATSRRRLWTLSAARCAHSRDAQWDPGAGAQRRARRAGEGWAEGAAGEVCVPRSSDGHIALIRASQTSARCKIKTAAPSSATAHGSSRTRASSTAPSAPSACSRRCTAYHASAACVLC